MKETIRNDGILDGFKVKEDFEVEYSTQTLPEADAEKLDEEWKEFYEKKLVKCTNEGDENVRYAFRKGDIVYFDETPLSKNLVLEIMKNHKDKIEELY